MGNELSQIELCKAAGSELNLYPYHSYGTQVTVPKKLDESFLSTASSPPSMKYHIDGKEVFLEAIAKNSLLPPIWKSEPSEEPKIFKEVTLAQYILSIGSPSKPKSSDSWTEETIVSLKSLVEETQRRLQFSSAGSSSSSGGSLHPNVLPLLDVIEGSSCLFLVHEAVSMSLEDCIRCSPHVLARHAQPASHQLALPAGIAPLQAHFSQLVTPVLPALTAGGLFLVYQLLQLLKLCHERGLVHGALSTQALRVMSSPAPPCSKAPAALWLLASCFHSPVPSLLPPLSWADAVRQWQARAMSNFEYLMWVNEAAGRRWGDPDLHPILPWVTDFSAPTGLRRDLARTKFRLTKGDEQLDQTFVASKAGRRHHVSDMLNCLSYYTYKARRVPVEVLQKHVRSNFQPSEYPASMARLYATTPHEAIPEFYTDADLFRSTNADMPDLGVPEWASSPEDFVAQHRALLESDAVSAQLHLWLDITYGYLVRGPEAVATKNVPLVDPQLPFNSGFVQLFSQPHPRRFAQQTVDVASMMAPEPSSALVLAPIPLSQPQQQSSAKPPIFSLFSAGSRSEEALSLGKLLSGLTKRTGGLGPVRKTDDLVAATGSSNSIPTTAIPAASEDATPPAADTSSRFVSGLVALERASAATAATVHYPPKPPLSPGRTHSASTIATGAPSPSASSVSIAGKREVTNVNLAGGSTYAASVQEDITAAASIISQMCSRAGCGALVDTPTADRLTDGPVQSLIATLEELGIDRALSHTIFPASFAPVYKFLSGFMQQTTLAGKLQHALAGLPQLQDEEYLSVLVFPFLLPLFRASPLQALPLFSYLARWKWPSGTPYWKNLQVPLEEMYQKRELADLQANILSPSFVDMVWRLFPLQTVIRRFVPFLFDVLRANNSPHASAAAGTIRLLVKSWGPVLALNHLITPLFGMLGRAAPAAAAPTSPTAVASPSPPTSKAVDILADLARDMGDAFVATHFLPPLGEVLLQFSTRSARAESGLSAALELLMRLLEVLSVLSLLRLLQPPAGGATHSSVLLHLLLNPPPYSQVMLSLAVILVTLSHRLGSGPTSAHIAPHVAQFLSTYGQMYDSAGRWKGTRGGDDAALQQIYSRQVVYALYIPLAAFVPTLSLMLAPGLAELLELLADQYQAAERRASISTSQPVLVPAASSLPTPAAGPRQQPPGSPAPFGSALPLSSLLASHTAAVQSTMLSTSPLGLSSPPATPPTAPAQLRRRTISTSGDAPFASTLVNSATYLPPEDESADDDDVVSETSIPLVPASPATGSALSTAATPSALNNSNSDNPIPILAPTTQRPWYDLSNWSPSTDFQEEIAAAATPEESAALQHIADAFPFRRQVHSWRAHVGTLRSLLSQGDSERLLVTSAFKDSIIRVWRIPEGRIQRVHLAHRSAVLAVDWVDRDGLVASCDSNEAQVWSVETGQELYRSEAGGADLTSLVAQSSGPRPSSHVLVTATAENTLQFVDLRAGEVVGEWKTVTGSASIRSIAVPADENWIATGSSAGVVCMLDLRTGCVLHSWKAFESSLGRIQARGNHHLLASSTDKAVGMKLFNLRVADPSISTQPLVEKTVRGAIDSWAVLRRDELITAAGHKLGYCSLGTEAPLVSLYSRRLLLPGTKQSFPSITALTHLPWHQFCVVGTETGHVKYLA